MPIDPGIIFNLKQPQVADPLQQQAAALNLVGGIQQVKGRQQDLQSGALDLQAKEQDIADEKTLRQLAADTNGDLDEIVKRAAGKVSQKRLSALTAAATEHKTKIAALAKTQTETGKTALEALKEQNQMVADEAAVVLDAAPELKQKAYLDARSRLIQKKLIQPNEAPAEYPGDDVMQQFFAVHAGYAKNLEREHKKNEESRAAEKHNADQAAAGIKLSADSSKALQERLVADAMANPDNKEMQAMGLSPDKRAELAMRGKELARANTPTELAMVAADPSTDPVTRDAAKAALKILEQHAIAGRPVTNVSVLPNADPKSAQLTGEDFIKTLPAGMSAQVKGITEGRTAMPGAASRSPDAQKLRNAVFQFDPTFTEQRAQVRKAFTTGPDAKNIGALNTAVVHLGRLGDAAEALGNGSFTPGNEAYNWLRDKFGSEKVTNFGLLKDAVAGEMAAALKGNATDIEIEKMGKSIRGANSPDQMRGVIQEGMAILNDKANTYSERYHALMPDDPWTPILPSAKTQLDKHNVKQGPGTITVISPEGVEGTITPDKWEAAQKRGFKKK